jgi:hypothetical protein
MKIAQKQRLSRGVRTRHTEIAEESLSTMREVSNSTGLEAKSTRRYPLPAY